MTFPRISMNAAVMNGQPCLKGTRLTVRRIVELVALYPDRAALFREFPELDEEGVRQALAFAAANLDDRSFPLAESA